MFYIFTLLFIYYTMKKLRIINFIIALSLSILNGYIFQFLYKYFQYVDKSENGLKDLPIFIQTLAILLISPIVETYLFQYIPNVILQKLKINRNYLLIIIPSIIFSLFHFYNIIYLFMTLFGGIILNYYYLKTKKISKHYFILTVLLHSLYNFYGYLFVI